MRDNKGVNCFVVKNLLILKGPKLFSTFGRPIIDPDDLRLSILPTGQL